MISIKLTELAQWERRCDDELAELELVELDADGADDAALPRALELLETRLPALRGLGVGAGLHAAVAAGLGARPQLAARVETLVLRAFSFGLTPRGTYDNLYVEADEWLALLRALPGIRALDLRRPDLSSAAARAGLLDAIAGMTTLEDVSLDLHGCPKTSLGALALLERLPPESVRRLRVRDGIIGADAIEARERPRLATLELLVDTITEDDAERLLTAIGPAPLRRLQLWGATPEALSMLVSARACAELHEFDHGRLDERCAAIVGGARFLPGLRRLALPLGRFDFAGVRAIFSSRQKYALAELELTYGQIGDDALELLAESPALPGIERLELGSCRVKGKGVKALCGAAGPLRLRELDLSRNKLGMTGARALASWHHAAQLEHLNLRSAGVPPKGRALLRGSPLAGALVL